MEDKKVTMGKNSNYLEERDRFTFLKTWADMFDMLPNYTAKGIYAEAIINYCFQGEDTDFNTDFSAVDNDDILKLLKLIWIPTREAAKYGLTKYCNGKKGGAPIGNTNAQKTTEKQPKNNQKTTEKQHYTTLHYTKKEIKLPLNKEKGGGGDVFSDENNKPTEAELTKFIKAEHLEYIQPEQLYQELTERSWKMIDGSDIKAWKSYVRKVNTDRKKDKQPIAAWAKPQPKNLSGGVYND